MRGASAADVALVQHVVTVDQPGERLQAIHPEPGVAPHAVEVGLLHPGDEGDQVRTRRLELPDEVLRGQRIQLADLALVEAVEVEALRRPRAAGEHILEQRQEGALRRDEVAQHLPRVPGRALAVDGALPVSGSERAEECRALRALLTQAVDEAGDAVGHALLRSGIRFQW